METNTSPAQVLASDYQADPETRSQNERKYQAASGVADVCFLCGRPLTAKAVENGKHIELLTNGEIITKDDPRSQFTGDYSAEQQGTFPVGSECAKRLPKGYAWKA